MSAPVARAPSQAHVEPMLNRRDMPQSDASSQVQPAAERVVLRSNPPAARPDWSAILDEIERDFPVTLARLAE